VTECERIRADAAGLAALPPDDPERAAAFAHAQGCPGCARALAEAARLQALLGEDEAPALPAGALARAAQAIEEELGREARRRSAWAAAAAAAVLAAVVGLARRRQAAPLDWGVAAALGGLAVALAALARGRPRTALGAALAAAFAAILAGGAGPVEAETGVHCLLTELAGATAVVVAGWLALRGSATRPARAAVAAAAAAGALAGAAGLQIACPAHELASHLVLFHAGGVLLAAVAAALLAGGRRVGGDTRAGATMRSGT
jgi:hypothetical protein